MNEALYSIIGFFERGGLFMWPLLICSIVALTTIILRGFALREKYVMPLVIESEIERLVPLIEGVRSFTDAVISVDTFRSDVAEAVLARLPEQHRTVLALRYMDDCSVPECAELIGRSVHATEALLVRARRAFKRQYPEGGTR